MGLCRYVNDYVIESMNKYSDKFIGYISIMPKAKDLGQETNRCMDKASIFQIPMK